MCSRIGFSVNLVNKGELSRFLSIKERPRLKKGEFIQSFFWRNKAFLPAEEEGLVKLYPWGSKDSLVKLPRGGCLKLESLRDGHLDWLTPKKIKIPSEMGYEKGHWFKTPKGLVGIKVRYHNLTRVYLLTMKASSVFHEYTGSKRMPVGTIRYLK